MERMREFCPRCSNIISNGGDLAVIQVMKFEGFSVTVRIFVVCHSCGIKIWDEIRILKKEVV